jgi:glycosyltransferase involved in cell wall biosynthesis
LAILARQEQADLVHAIYFLPPAMRRPTVVTVHDISFELFPKFFTRSALVRNRALIRASARGASRVITVSETSRREILDRYQLPEERVVAIPNGVAPVFRPAAQWAPFSGGRPLRVLAVGTLEPRKNLIGLLDALRLIGSEITIALRVIGPNGFQAKEIRARLSTAVQTQILGWASERQLIEEYQAADVFVYPSIYEGFGLPVLEAMASGTPVVASTGGSIPEVAGDAALLVDPFDVHAIADAIRRIATDATLVHRLRERGLARASEFTWERSAKSHATVYRSLMQ